MSYIEIPKPIIDEYLDDLPSNYDTDVAKPIIDPTSNKEECEQAVMDFYTLMNEGTAPSKVEWFKTPGEVINKYGKGVTIYCTYFNINWIYFLKSFMAKLETRKDEVDNKIFDEYADITVLAQHAFKVLKNVFGVCEMTGTDAEGNEIKYDHIVLIEKPEIVCIENERLHSTYGPAFKYADDYCFYYIDGVFFEEDLYVKVLKTGMQDLESPMMDDLRPDEKDKLSEFIAEYEKKNGTIPELSVKELLDIPNQEQKSKAIKYIGFSKIIDSDICKVTDSEVVQVKGVTDERTTEYQVLEIDLGMEVDGLPSRFVKVNCWSTDRMYVLQVDPRSKQTQTAMGAIAWTCKKPDGSRCSAEEYREMAFQS